MKRIKLFLFLFTVSIFTLTAQTADQMKLIQSELDKRGLTQMEVEQKLSSKGVDINAITIDNYKEYQAVVMEALDELEAEKKLARTKGTESANNGPTQTGNAFFEFADASQKGNLTYNPNDIYGHNFFTGKRSGFVRTTDGAMVPDNYILGEGDEIHISIFGTSQTDIQQRIGTDGFIRPAGTAKIYLKGLTLAQARQSITANLSSAYSFQSDQIVITVVSTRNILVNVFGEVNTSGGYTMSALNTVFNALVMAGGPAANGSIRDIQLIRNSKKYSIDLYKYFLNPEKDLHIEIQNNDLIYIPMAQTVVSLQGSVNRPMRYELKPNEDLKQLLEYAGGLAEDAAVEYGTLLRYVEGEQKIIEFALEDIISGKEKISLVNGDVISIKKIGKPMEQYVEIQGSVYYPGRYDIESHRTLSALIGHAQPKLSTDSVQVFVHRLNDNSVVQVLTVPYPGVNGNPDFALQKQDVVHIYDKSDFITKSKITVVGAVRQTVNVDWTPNLTIRDLLTMAGGLAFGAAYDRIEVFHVDVSHTQEMKQTMITLHVDDDYNLISPIDFTVRPYDKIVVRRTPEFTTGRVIELNGQIRYPGQYVLSNKETRLTDIIERAGGLLEDADVYGTKLTRLYKGTGDITVDLAAAMQNKDSDVDNPILFEGDVINIGRKENTVVIMPLGTRMSQYVAEGYSTKIDSGGFTFMNDSIGQFMRNSERKVLIYTGKHNAKWYIQKYAGGFTRFADKNSVTVTYANNQMVGTTRGFLWIRKYPDVEPGSTISMSLDDKKIKKEREPKEKVNWQTISAQTTAFATTLVSLVALIKTLK